LSLQHLENQISDIEDGLQTLSVTRHGVQSELTDLTGARTELQCIIEDLRSADAVAGGNRTKLESELTSLARTISSRENELDSLIPEWEARRAKESAEKRRLEEADMKLQGLFAKQGRLTRFRSKGERDKYLRSEIASIEAHRATQATSLRVTREELGKCRLALVEVEGKVVDTHGRIEDGRQRARDLGDQVLTLKDQHAEVVEKRKELWREDTRFDTLVKQALEQLKKAEGTLAGMVDRVGAT
jgi:structural maintenance of chromosome 3 (chondroitin sulfate proteoglycan 6)